MLYDTDIVAWASEQARLLRAGRFGALDLEHLADAVRETGLGRECFPENNPWTVERSLDAGFWPELVRAGRGIDRGKAA
ncbi:protein of unknown function DUF29 [Methylomagnum ishizawai]|uniref:Uncharacterized protein n=2 Tax=Methylomagnum ishizawai TaxID=1760988 RepID=A0A1Y6D4D4_9GAMM|nr:protein of unknown function DUF29 [Methylomagnum ishizawai]SMF97808.1 protein of unknown function DUF29 [Methylomagnum ishizawai]